MSRRPDINTGEIIGTAIAVLAIGLATGSIWAFIMFGVALDAVLTWLLIIKHTGPTKRFTLRIARGGIADYER